MPGFDGSGPANAGPMTGRGRGYCIVPVINMENYQEKGGVKIMPGGDHAGPWGRGPMTGRAMGMCAGYGQPGYLNPAGMWGFGWGPGRGRGFRGYYGGGRFFRAGVFPHWETGAWYSAPWVYDPFFPVPAEVKPEDEAEVLKERASYFESVLAEINKRISELESKITA